MPASILWNRPPLPGNLLAPLPLGAIRMGGWLAEKIGAEMPPDLSERLARAGLLGDKDLMDRVEAEGLALLEADAPARDALRALPMLWAATGNKAIPLYLLRHLRGLRDALQAGERLPAREANDTGDLTQAALWLYNMTGQKGLLELCHLLKAQSSDWMSTFHVFPQAKAVVGAPDRATEAYWRVHGPTVAAALKIPALQALFEGGYKNETGFDTGFAKLRRYHGAAHGVFSADPLLAGQNPTRATDPAVISELLYTLRTLLWAQGKPAHADTLEALLYGPVMAGTAPQAANQTRPGGGPAGLSRAAECLWMASCDDGLAALLYAPCEVRWRVGGRAVRLTVETAYPHEERVSIRIAARAPVEFPLRLRIPAWADGATIRLPDGSLISAQAGTFACVSRTWTGGDEVVLTLPMEVRTEAYYHQTIAVRRGPLTYALPVAAGVPWNIALLPGAVFEAGMSVGRPVLETDAVVIPAWHASGYGPAAPPVAPRAQGERLRVTLSPYGETAARIAQFPVAVHDDQGGIPE